MCDQVNKQNKAEIFLFLTTFIWGGNCVITKIALEGLSPLRLIAIRFLIASLISLPFFIRLIPTIDRSILRDGFWLGFLMFIGFVAQTVGLVYTSASHSAFITSMMVIFTPIFQWILLKQAPKFQNIVGIVIVCAGLWFLTAPSAEGFNLGDGLTLLCAAIFGFYLIELDRISKQQQSSSLLAFLQMASCAFYASVIAWPLESAPFILTRNNSFGLAYLVVFATLVTTYTQVRYQRDTTPTRAAILFTIEPVWAAILGYLLLGEQLGVSGIAGGGLIIAGILISTFD
jgi:drug/metabolite transporter (DMT)-like permease